MHVGSCRVRNSATVPVHMQCCGRVGPGFGAGIEVEVVADVGVGVGVETGTSVRVGAALIAGVGGRARELGRVSIRLRLGPAVSLDGARNLNSVNDIVPFLFLFVLFGVAAAVAVAAILTLDGALVVFVKFEPVGIVAEATIRSDTASFGKARDTQRDMTMLLMWRATDRTWRAPSSAPTCRHTGHFASPWRRVSAAHAEQKRFPQHSVSTGVLRTC